MTSSTMLRKRNAWLYRQPNLNWKTLLVFFLNGAVVFLTLLMSGYSMKHKGSEYVYVLFILWPYK